MNKSEKALLDAVGSAIARNNQAIRGEINAAKSEVDDKIAALDPDGSTILKTAAGALLSANLSALSKWLDGIEWHKSKPVGDEDALPKLVKSVVMK